jgi:hypothetical protein
VRASYDAAQMQFDTNTRRADLSGFDAVLLPAASVHSWKFQFLADELTYKNARQPGDPR